MMGNLVKLLTNDKDIRIFLAEATEILEGSNLKAMKTGFARRLYTNIFVDCCLLRGFLTEADRRLKVSFWFKPAGCTAYGDVTDRGNVNCTFSPQLASYHGDFADLVGEGASLAITRVNWRGEMFTGTVELKSASVDACFSDFYTGSEQTKTIFRTWIENGIARGCLVQPLPSCPDERLHLVLERIDGAKKEIVTEQWAELPAKVFPDATVVEEFSLQSACGCSKESVLAFLMSMEAAELKKLIETGENVELECGRCGKRYSFSTKDLETVIKNKGREKELIPSPLAIEGRSTGTMDTSRLKRKINPMPKEVEERLIRENLMEAYRKRPPYQQNDYLGWILKAKRPETKEKRIAQMLEELRRGDKYMGMDYRAKK